MAEKDLSRRRRRAALGLGSAGLLAIGALGWLLLGSGGPGPRRGPEGAGAELTVKVGRGPLTISFTERGTIKAASSEQIYSTLEGTSTIVNVVPEGSTVKKGDVLVELDSSELTQLYNQQAIAVETARAALSQADEAVAIQKLQNESDLKAAELAQELAAIDRKKYEEGDWQLARDKADADIHIAEEEMKRAETKLNWTRKLAQKGYVTGTELIADALSVEKAKVQAKQARGAREVLEKYTHQKDQRKFESDLQQADLKLKQARMKAESQLAQSLADQKGKRSTYDLSLKRLDKIRDQIERTKILAPQDGMVVYRQDGGRYGRDDRIIEQGATVRENQHLIDLPDLSVMAVVVHVPEARIHQVAQGVKATVTIDAQTELALRGTVTKIGLLPDYVNRWLNPDLKVYQTEITIDPDQDTGLLRPGMSARVELQIAEIPEAIYVPLQSVTTIDGAPVAYVLEGGKPVPRRVGLGPSNDSFVVIASGLAEGEVVQLNAPKPQGTPPVRMKTRGKEREAQPEEIGGAEAAGVPGGKGRKRGEDGERGERRGQGGGVRSGDPRPVEARAAGPEKGPAPAPVKGAAAGAGST